MAENVYIGTDLKFLVEPTAAGFDKERDDFTVTVSRGSNELTWEKSQLAIDGQGNYYICFNTEELGTGLYMLTVKTRTPDDDFEDGYRDDIVQMPLINVAKLKK